MKGAPLYLPDDIKLKELTDMDIPAIRAVRMTSRREANKGQPIQAVQVRTSREVSLQQLKGQAGKLRWYTVTWEKFRGAGTPPVCNNCQGIARSDRLCFLPARCAICCGQHRTDTCREKISDGSQITKKCANCPEGPNNNHQSKWKEREGEERVLAAVVHGAAGAG